MSAPEVHREIERKLDVSDDFTVPDLVAARAVGSMTRQPTLSLVAVYFDTTDLRLARARTTLRRRTGGIDDGWHLKLPPAATLDANDAHRDEVQMPLDDASAPPTALVDLVHTIVADAPLVAVATVRNERHRFALADRDGRPLAELTDDHVDATRADGTRVRFRELEIEAVDGRTLADLDVVVDALLAAGAQPSSFASKAARALGPMAIAEPVAP